MGGRLLVMSHCGGNSSAFGTLNFNINPQWWASMHATGERRSWTHFLIDVTYESPRKNRKNLNKIASTLYWMDLRLKGKKSSLPLLRSFVLCENENLCICVLLSSASTSFFVCNSFVKFVALGIGSLLFLTHWNVPNFTRFIFNLISCLEIFFTSIWNTVVHGRVREKKILFGCY
jgi:hypothetical protein